MTPSGQTICLCMIVKNEAPVIRRCLDSVRSIIDHWIIVDTGSTDGTQEIVRDHFRDLPGEVVERPWRDFAHNRSEALALARPHGDYSLIIDADDAMVVPDDFRTPDLDADSYNIDIDFGAIRYQRPQLVKAALGWRYEGVIHEYLVCEAAKTAGHLPIVLRIHEDGARRRDPETYKRDAAVLERAVAEETDPFRLSRYTFYLAQSYRDSGQKEKALDLYLRRADMGFWDQEVYCSLLYAGRAMQALGYDSDDVLATYERANAACPSRAEAAHAASRVCRLLGRNRQGYEVASPFKAVSSPSGGLFVEQWIHDYGLLDEYAVNAYWAGLFRTSLEANLTLLARKSLPDDQRQRITDNARFAFDKLPRERELGSRAQPGFLAQHALAPAADLHSRSEGAPRVMVAILAKQKELALPLYLECIEALDYPKQSIVLYIRTNNNEDKTEDILRSWVDRVGPSYAAVELDAENVSDKVERFRVHEWNATRFRVLGHIRNVSLRRALDHGCEYYFVADVDNFVRPCTLGELVALDLPIVAPFLRLVDSNKYYSNYHAEIDANGYYKECDQYHWILNRWVCGIIELPLVHCTYLIRSDVIGQLSYQDGTDRYEYVVFAESARNAEVPQYLDNRQVYGYIAFDESGDLHVADGFATARARLAAELERARSSTQGPDARLAQSRAGGRRTTWIEPGRPKTLIFCTSFVTAKNAWQDRYRRWVEAIKQSSIHHDAILIVDDGSSVLPDWPDATIATDPNDISHDKKILIHHFVDHLGRRAVFDFPGWYRSFVFAGRYAKRHGYRKVIHLESDAFLIGERIQRYVNDLSDGWTALWCPLYQGYPETAVQVMAGEAVGRFADIERTHPHSDLIGREFELQLPFDVVEKRFVGNRYGEYLSFVPGNAEYACQVVSDREDGYYWWMRNMK